MMEQPLSNHQDSAFLELKAFLEPFGITQFYTDDYGAYKRQIDPTCHSVGKANT
jgi:insertion element IS1 protein InsB